ncbi:hypothetical protein GCM10010172_06440 [Paractinoplanes ferrugineus]|uniref:Superoxide dismutase n=1 Tax=Paractinoplanes ferrugineus TaxID=113564 RepID=A0A919MF70_9ACTN|nr:superoxide dismutase [Actinoplanes ferrugineus]GIE12439.1 hypothetical protein Afe05nite_42790 [Actinoplanes ferrugineus]
MRRHPLLAPPAVNSGDSPRTVALPAGFAPEGIAIAGIHAYVGSRATGSVYRADLVTGAGELIHTGPGTPTAGLCVDDRGRAFLSGNTGGDIRVISVRTGALLASYRIAGFPNDVVLTRAAAWFTDSFSATLHRLPIAADGTLGPSVTALPLTGVTITAGTVNLNGICATPDGRALLVVQSNTGLLLRVDPATGAATRVPLGGASLVHGDGLLLDGHTLHVVRNRADVVEVFRLNRGGTTAAPVTTITDPRFATPTAAALSGRRLYVVNARLSTPVTADVPYAVVALP